MGADQRKGAYTGLKWRVSLFLIVTVSALGLGLGLRWKRQTQLHSQLDWPGTVAIVPLEDYGGHLFLSGYVDGLPTPTLILDSGAADMLIRPEKLQLSPLRRNISSTKVKDLSWQWGDLTLHDRQSAIITAAEVARLSQYFGRSVDGIIGYEFFEQLVVELDHQRRILRLHRPQTYRYSGQGQRLPLHIEGQRAYIPAIVLPYGHSALPGKFLVDLGSNEALSVTAGCGLGRQLIAAAPRTIKRQLTTLTGQTSIVMGRVQQLQLGSFTLKSPLATFASSATQPCEQLTGRIGAQILRQFKVIFNYPQQQLILEPTVSKPYEYDLSGLRLQADGPTLNIYRIASVFPKTPAATANLQVGDILTQINHQSAQSLTLGQIRQQLSQPEGSVVLTIQRGSKSIRTRLDLKSLL
jgi:hypothetical protein